MDKPEKSSSPAIVVVLVVMFVALPMFYVLSLGPAVWLVEKGYFNQALAERFYYPLIVLHSTVEPIRGVLEWYVSFFEK